MLSQTDAVKQAWAATDRTLDIIVTVDGKDYQATEINSLNYDAGAFTGDTLGIGSTYENSVTIEFSSVVEAFKQGLTVLPKVGILVNGKFEYTSLGTFIISEVNRDRNNNLTTIKALDQMCMLEGQYKPTVGDMASPLDIIADIANQGGVTVNTGELQHLPKLPNIKKIEGQTLRTAIGWVAQLYDGFATFDRDGKLTIRTTATPDCTITPSEYQQGGLTKNEVSYKTGGIKVTVNTKKTDDSGQEVDDTTMLQAGETTGSQIELTNDSMTSDLLTTVWTGIKDITYYPYTLNWFGNPNLEAGDWVTLTDTQGNQFNVPVNQYTMSFNGGLESTISATQSSSSAGGYAYTGSAGSIKNMIEALQVRNTASGNNVYPPSYQGQPNNPKKGDVWYKQNGNNIEVWIYQEENGTLAWVRTPLDGEVKAELQTLGKKTDEDLTRVKNELSSEAEGQWQSMKEATSKVASDLSAAKDSLATVKSDLSATKSSLNTVASDLSTAKNDLTNVSKDLSDTKSNLGTVSNDLSETKNNLATVTDDLSKTKSNLADTGQKLETAVSDFQKKTDQLSGSLETANSKIEFNGNSISEVKQTAGQISTTVNDHSGKISQLQLTADKITNTLSNGGTNLLSGTRDFSFTNQSWASNPSWGSVPVNQTDQYNDTEHVIERKIIMTADTFQGFWLPGSNTIGQTYTLSFDARSDNGKASVWQAGLEGNFVGTSPALTTDWIRYNYTVNVTQADHNWVIYFQTSADDNVYVRKIQLEYGDTPTPWNPSSGDISNIAQTASQLTSDMKDAKGDISSLQQTASSLTTRVGSAEGNISAVTQTANAVKTDLANTKGDVASVKAKADSLTTQLADANGNISALQQTAAGLKSTVADHSGNISQLQQDSKGLTTRVGSAEGNISQLQQTANQITTTLSNGGTNLLSGTRDFSFTNQSWANNQSWGSVPVNQIDQYNDTEHVIERKIIMTADTFQGFWLPGSNTVGQTYTLSFDARSDNGKASVWQAGLEGNFLGTSPALTTNWTRYHYTVNVTQADHTWVIYFQTSEADNVYIRKLQLECGDTATPWQPSSGDISSLQQTASQLTVDMKDAKGNISSIQETAKELKATVGDDNTGLISSVKAIPGQISSAITASKQATVVTSAVDVHNMTTAGYYLLKGPLTNSPVDAWAFLRVITSAGGDRIYHQIWKDSASTVYTEEWTGSWSDWAMHINSDNLKSNVITAINQSTEGVSITGSKITLDGNVNITPGFTLSADYIKAGTLSADQISGGTLDLSKNITVKDLTANSISSGSISGQNLNINLDNGVVEFTKGNLHSTDGGFNISIDTKSFYLDMGNDTKLWIDSNGFHLQESDTQHLWLNKGGLHNYTTSNSNGVLIQDSTLSVLNNNGEGLVAQNGLLQFSTLPTWLNFDANSTLTAQAYGIIGPDKNLFGSSNGLFVKGREGVVIGTNSYNGETFLGSLFNANSISGSGISLSDDMTKAALFFTEAPLILAGGPTWDDSNKMSVKPYISVGSDWYYSHSGTDMNQGGNGTYTRGNNIIVSSRNTNIIGYDWINFKSFGRIAFDAQYVHSYPTYNQTTSAGANVFVAPDGALIRSSSARKYKTDIQEADNDYGNKLIEFTPQKWIDKAEKKRYEEDPEKNKKPGYYYGLIADDLDAAGLDMLVNYGAEGEVEGINYDRLAVALLPVIKSLKDQVASLKEQLKVLTK